MTTTCYRCSKGSQPKIVRKPCPVMSVAPVSLSSPPTLTLPPQGGREQEAVGRRGEAPLDPPHDYSDSPPEYLRNCQVTSPSVITPSRDDSIVPVPPGPGSWMPSL